MKNKINNRTAFCTLFNVGYISRGLALYESIHRFMPESPFFIFAFDNTTEIILRQLNLPNVTVISLEDFEDDELRSIKSSRNVTEYCWTCSSCIVDYVLDNYSVDSCTYLDGDIYFFNSPLPLRVELDNKDVSIISNKWSPEYDETEELGKYCVAFMTFKRTVNSQNIVKWWREKCIDWCYDRYDIDPNGYPRYGDQKYLDDWKERFSGIKELQHIGAGIAPWNIQQYTVFPDSSKIIQVKDKANDICDDLIFYHFHQLRFLSNSQVTLGPYKLTSNDIEVLYKPYVKHLCRIEEQIKEIMPNVNVHGISKLKTIVNEKQKKHDISSLCNQ